MTRLVPLLAAAALLLPACGAGSLDDQIADLQASADAGDYEQVVSGAPAVLERCEAEGAASKTWRVEKLRLSSMARLGRGEDALEQLGALSTSHPKNVSEKLYAELGGYVMEAGNLQEAIAVLDAGKKAYPEKGEIFDANIEQIKERAQAAGDSDALESLKALGYL